MRTFLFLSLILFLPAFMLSAEGVQEADDGTLASVSVKTGPVMDGQVDDIWKKAPGLTVGASVPAYPIFDKSYHGKEYVVTMQSVHTKDDIYFLYQWTGDESESLARQSWYYNETEGKWMQKPKYKADEYYDPVYEDKFAVIWEIDGTIPDFKDAGCLILCHGDTKSTPAEGQKGDTWHWKLDRTGPVHQIDDKWLTYADGNGRKADQGSSAYKSNSQELTDTEGNTVKVPKYWIPGKKDYHWIMKDDPEAKKIVSIDSNGNLVDEAGNVLKKENFYGDSTIQIPSIYNIQPATGSRGDVTAYHNYNKETKTWTLEVKRSISTGNPDDVDFSDPNQFYFFSIAVFDAAAIAHATPGGMTGDSYTLVIK